MGLQTDNLVTSPVLYIMSTPRSHGGAGCPNWWSLMVAESRISLLWHKRCRSLMKVKKFFLVLWLQSQSICISLVPCIPFVSFIFLMRSNIIFASPSCASFMQSLRIYTTGTTFVLCGKVSSKEIVAFGIGSPLSSITTSKYRQYIFETPFSSINARSVESRLSVVRQ